MADRRCLERFALDLPVKVLSVSPRPDSAESRLRTVDISSSGAFVCSRRPLSKGTRMLLEVQLPARGRQRQGLVQVSGTVVRSGPEGMALCFDRDYRIMTAG